MRLNIPEAREALRTMLDRANAPKAVARDIAPATLPEVMRYARPDALTVWAGASEGTIWGDAETNYRLRAWHDDSHVVTGLGFDPREEITLGRINAGVAGRLVGDGLARLVEIEVSGQAEFYLKSGTFVADQIAFTEKELA